MPADSPYAIAKLAAHQLVGALRAHDGLHASSGIVVQPRVRAPAGAVRDAQDHAARRPRSAWACEQELTLGSLDAVRDWSFAGDIVHGAWLMLQQDDARRLRPGERRGAHGGGVRGAAFAYVGLDAERYVRVDPALVRPPESDRRAWATRRKARERLGWEPRVGFEELVERMVQADLRSLQAPLQPRSPR